jgi:hypothetical protein
VFAFSERVTANRFKSQVLPHNSPLYYNRLIPKLLQVVKLLKSANTTVVFAIAKNPSRVARKLWNHRYVTQKKLESLHVPTKRQEIQTAAHRTGLKKH